MHINVTACVIIIIISSFVFFFALNIVIHQVTKQSLRSMFQRTDVSSFIILI